MVLPLPLMVTSFVGGLFFEVKYLTNDFDY
jgi:hypothetical protein